MPYYISASDETSGDDHRSPFTRGGFIADSRAWTNDLVPAWGAMLAAPPSIASLHMNQLRDGRWCKASGLTQADANHKIDQAISIVVGLKSMVRLRITQDGGAFKDHIASLLRRPDFMGGVPRSDKSRVRWQLDSPDIPALIGYWLYALKHAHDNREHCERIDFYVEEKERITSRAREIFSGQLPGACDYCGLPEFKPFIGRFVPVPKASTDATLAYPVQTADLLLWFFQRDRAGRLSDEDALRLKSLRAIPGWDSGRDVEDIAKQGDRWRELVKGNDGIT